ncbi:MAG: hypothetical protein J6V75_04495 [Bacteroidaceae bacterium]|nr:hypothetical protein [Bacteroidaceae bacterium]
MKTPTILITLLLQLLLLGCTHHQPTPLNPNYDGIFAHQTPMDMTPVLEVYDWASEKGDSIDMTELVLKLVPAAGRYILADTPDDEIENNWYVSMTDTIPVLCIPDELRTKYNLYANAEQYYNGYMLLFNLESLYEICFWNLDKPEEERIFTPEEVLDAIQGINIDVMRDPGDRMCIEDARDSVLDYLETYPGYYRQEDTVPLIYLARVMERFDRYSYFYYEGDMEPIEAILDSTMNKVHAGQWAQERFERYLMASEDEQLEVMLKELAECRDFDEQCDLWCLWSDCRQSLDEDLWVIAVGTRLMDSEQYTPMAILIWLRWRVLFQEAFCGMSRDSAIPNDYYNEYRKKCFVASVLHFERHEDDIFAMFLAEYMLSRSNMNRLGGWLGNNAMFEGPELMPKRYE